MYGLDGSQPSRRRELLLGAGLFMCLLMVNAIATRQTQQLHADAQLIVHTHQVIEALDDLLATVKDAETEQRGYLLTGEANYLQGYDTAIAATKQKITRIEQLIKGSPDELDRVPPLQTALNLEVQELADGVDVRRQESFDSAKLVALTDHEEKTMNVLEGEVHQMHAFEEGLLVDEEQANDRDYHWALGWTVAGLVLALATAATFVAWLFPRRAATAAV